MSCYSEKCGDSYFSSETNIVALKCREGKHYIEKRYCETLKDYPSVNWPIERAAVEAALLTFLKERLNGSRIFVPVLYKFCAPDILEMEYCMGTKLFEAPYEDIYNPYIWEQLFSFLYGLTDVKEEYLLEMTKDAFVWQQKIFDCMKHWKFQDVIRPPEESYGCLCLGDVSLSNILVSVRGFTLLDLECAHIGYLGYDIGQILGMMEVYRPDRRMGMFLEYALENSVKDPLYKECCYYWKKRFAEYYFAKREGCLHGLMGL